MRFPFAMAVAVAVCLMGCSADVPTEAQSEQKSQIGASDVVQTVQRPIEEFVAAQGTFCWDDGMGGCILFVPPVENFLGWSDPARGICAAFDYAGLADEWLTAASGGAMSLGTTFSGSVTERVLADGRSEVHVRLQTKNAMTFAVDGCNDFATDPLLFGYRATDIFDGADAALGDGLLHIKYMSPTPGAPLPDFLQLLFFPEEGQEITMMQLSVRAAGALRSAFGVMDGTPGRLTCTQTGLFFTGFNGAVSDGFPVEQIILQPVGGGRGSVE